MSEKYETFDSIFDLNKSIDKFEANLIESIEDEIILHFVRKGFIGNNNTFATDGRSFLLSCSYETHFRKLLIKVYSSHRTDRMTKNEVEIASYGRITAISFIWPEMLAKRNQRLVDKVEQIVRERYVYLKRTFLDLYVKSGQTFYAGLQNCINAYMEVYGCSHLRNLAIPAVSRTSSVKFRYAVSASAAETLRGLRSVSEDVPTHPLQANPCLAQ